MTDIEKYSSLLSNIYEELTDKNYFEWEYSCNEHESNVVVEFMIIIDSLNSTYDPLLLKMIKKVYQTQSFDKLILDLSYEFTPIYEENKKNYNTSPLKTEKFINYINLFKDVEINAVIYTEESDDLDVLSNELDTFRRYLEERFENFKIDISFDSYN